MEIASLKAVLYWIGILLIAILVGNNEKDNFKFSECNAQQQGRFLINTASDFAEIFSQFPQNPVEGAITPVLRRTQNDLVARSAGFGRSGSEAVLLSNNYRDARFFVYNDKKNPNSSFELDLDHESKIPQFRVGANSQLKILVHGFNSEYSNTFPQATKNAYLSATNYPVITVDWKPLSQPAAQSPVSEFLYAAVTDNVSRVGHRIYHLVDFLMQNKIISNLKQVHLVGHSLGSHVSGHAGQLIKARFGKRVGRITALDPAAPLFRSVGNDLKLDSGDADFVDVMHTSLAGIFSPIGHVDFYPNGGQVQPQCLQNILPRKLECNHLAAYHFFEKSIKGQRMVGCACNSYQEFRSSCGKTCYKKALMGEYVSHGARGRFFLDFDPNKV